MSSWFSLEIRKYEFPWVFEKGERPSLIISTLEALAILVALVLRFGNARDTSETTILIVLSVTDNRGNGAALSKLMSSRFPATYMKARELRTIVEWEPREYNKEADQLANGNREAYDPEKRLHVQPSTLIWNILPAALEAGREAERAFQNVKASCGLTNQAMVSICRKSVTTVICFVIERGIFSGSPFFSFCWSFPPFLFCYLASGYCYFSCLTLGSLVIAEWRCKCYGSPKIKLTGNPLWSLIKFLMEGASQFWHQYGVRAVREFLL